MERVQWFQLHSGERLLSNQAGRVVRRGGGGGGGGGESEGEQGMEGDFIKMQRTY